MSPYTVRAPTPIADERGLGRMDYGRCPLQGLQDGGDEKGSKFCATVSP